MRRGFSVCNHELYLAGAESDGAGAGVAAGGALGGVSGEVGRVEGGVDGEGAEPTVDEGDVVVLATLSSRPRKPINAKARRTTTTAPAIQPHMELDSSSMMRGGILFGSVVRNGSFGS